MGSCMIAAWLKQTLLTVEEMPALSRNIVDRFCVCVDYYKIWKTCNIWRIQSLSNPQRKTGILCHGLFSFYSSAVAVFEIPSIPCISVEFQKSNLLKCYTSVI